MSRRVVMKIVVKYYDVIILICFLDVQLQCAGVNYNFRTHVCCDDVILEKLTCNAVTTVNPCFKGCCGNVPYTKRTSRCCNGQVVSKRMKCVDETSITDLD